MTANDETAHHAPGGGFRAPWLGVGEDSRGGADLLKWQWQRLVSSLPPDPDPARIPRGLPDPAIPRADSGEVRATWLGHATFLLQIGSSTVLTDPIFSARASPFAFAGPARFLPAALSVAELPPVDAVVLSHDHYDHLDEGSVRALHARFGAELTWVTPLGYADWFAAREIHRVVELDWWQSTDVRIPTGGRAGEIGEEPEAVLRIDAAPAQHWTRRGLGVNQRLWASFALRSGGRSVYFGGDSGYFEGYPDIGARLGPFDLVLMPIGAYEPRWFMRAAHMNPEEAVQAFRDLGETGAFIGMHWGTFRLTDEPPLEPPQRARAAWAKAGLPARTLCEPGIGGTVRIPPG